MNKEQKHAQSGSMGFTLVELIFYMAILVLLLFLIVTTMLVIADSQLHVSSARSVEHAASLSMDRVVREARSGLRLDTAASTLSATSSEVVIEQEGGEVTFSVVDGVLMIDSGTGDRPLTGSALSVSEFRVDRIETSVSEAVKVVLEFEYEIEGDVREERFYSTVILRGSYENQ